MPLAGKIAKHRNNMEYLEKELFFAISPGKMNAFATTKATASFGRMTSLIVQYSRNSEGSYGGCKQLEHVS